MLSGKELHVFESDKMNILEKNQHQLIADLSARGIPHLNRK